MRACDRRSQVNVIGLARVLAGLAASSEGQEELPVCLSTKTKSGTSPDVTGTSLTSPRVQNHIEQSVADAVGVCTSASVPVRWRSLRTASALGNNPPNGDDAVTRLTRNAPPLLNVFYCTSSANIKRGNLHRSLKKNESKRMVKIDNLSSCSRAAAAAAADGDFP
ncbi:hypothetical protein F2P81_002664 [Scophthalmus maximus]|uniref:Uncharacterized protein n=1 Tax=Scophthalmus maximus TaxID=52904 RepID=A0A6A4TLJ3_SCOMX|nr:hypothetical protein F2P81_002664 [Scophthalmus maximus]